jgi:MtfA peptidase
MPQDTIWIDNKGSFITISDANKIDTVVLKQMMKYLEDESEVTYTYVAKNSAHADSIFKVITKNKVYTPHTKFDKDKAYYDKLGNYIAIGIVLGAILMVYYGYRRLQQYKRNPFDENENDWIEIGSSPRTDYGSFYDLGSGLNYRQKQPLPPIREYLIYEGSDLNFTQEKISAVLDKRFPYFAKLGVGERTRFLNRHKKFMQSKSFKIHDTKGFKEMPILICATAIQLSFGLNEYLLPYYKNIHIFPQEFLGMHPTMRFLEGNVSGNNINISWKHYLKGYENINDGENLGLHEMAHAYYAQNFTFAGDRDKCFINGFANYNQCGNRIFEAEKIQTGKLFSDYALKNFQEFWAESVEIFFEKPLALKEEYPELSAIQQLIFCHNQ